MKITRLQAAVSDVTASEVYNGFTQEELEYAFDQIKNKENWKLPIEAWIHPDDYLIADSATIYFTGGHCSFTKESDSVVRIYSAGYYTNIGA